MSSQQDIHDGIKQPAEVNTSIKQHSLGNDTEGLVTTLTQSTREIKKSSTFSLTRCNAESKCNTPNPIAVQAVLCHRLPKNTCTGRPCH